MAERKLIKVPPLRKKGRSLVELGADSLAAALAWEERAAAVAPADPAPVEPVPSSGRVAAPAAPAGERVSVLRADK